MRLKADEGFTYFRDTAELQCRVADGLVFQFKKLRQLRLVEFAHPLADILQQNEIEKGLQFRVVVRRYERPAGVGAFLAGDG